MNIIQQLITCINFQIQKNELVNEPTLLRRHFQQGAEKMLCTSLEFSHALLTKQQKPLKLQGWLKLLPIKGKLANQPKAARSK